MSDDTFPEQDPRPDEDAWEAYLNFVRPILGASDETGLSNADITELETALGAALPFEAGLFLVMGVPDAFPWRMWAADSGDQLDSWNAEIATTLKVPVEELASAPPLLPLFANVAVLCGDSVDEPTNEANPLVRVDPAGVSLAGLDLADWLHREFDAPLPWWPDNQLRTFPFWSERLAIAR